MPHKTAATVAHTIGVDTGKNTLPLASTTRRQCFAGEDCPQPDRSRVPRCLVGIEAGMATHYVARELC